jgi:hypothetical protein
MPRGLDAGDRRTLFVAGGIFLFLVLVTLLVAPSQGVKTELPTTYSSASGGAKAAILLLQESGYRVTRWEQRLRDLKDGPHTTLVLAEPNGAPAREDYEALRTFIADGGRVIATGSTVASFIPGSGIVPRPWMVTWEQANAVVPTGLARSAPVITIVAQAYWTADSSATRLYQDADHHTLAVRYGVGRGEVIWWAAPTPLSNAGIGQPGNLEFFLACLGAPGERRVLWDEYFHGYQRSGTRSAEAAPFLWLGLQLGLVAAAVLLTFSRRSGPVLPPSDEVRLSPLEFVQTLGGLYQRAGATSVAVDICHQRFRYWLTRRLGMAGQLPVEDLERALADRWHFHDADFASTMRQCEAARDHAGLGHREALRLVQALFDYARRLRLFGAGGRSPGDGRRGAA